MRLSRLAIGAFVGAAMALGQGSAEAQDLSEPAVIAVVNLERIMTEATAVVSAREQLQELSVKVQQDITERENKLREEDQGLQQQRAPECEGISGPCRRTAAAGTVGTTEP